MSGNIHTYEIVDRRGTKPDLRPDEAFALIHRINGVAVFVENCYSLEEAERSRDFRLARHE